MNPSPPDRNSVQKRLLSVSRLNGWMVLIFSALSTLVVLTGGYGSGLIVCILVLISPVMELTGHYGLKRGDVMAARWLPRSQLWLLVVVALYAMTRLLTFDPREILDAFTAEQRTLLIDLVGDEAAMLELIRKVVRATYATVVIATFLYQGGLWLYYRNRARALLSQSSH